MEQIQIQVVKEKMWRQFNSLSTEMIVTKKGRALFPKLDYTVTGLNPHAYYAFELGLERISEIKYKFDGGQWHEASTADPRIIDRNVRHPDNFKTGEQWMKENLSFAKMKITNNQADCSPFNIVVQSLHRYMPVLTVIKMRQMNDTVFSEPDGTMPYYDASDVRRYRFDFTSFVVVTAYQNSKVTDLKVSCNKYARGYKTSRKRSLSETIEENDEKNPAKLSAMSMQYNDPLAMQSMMIPQQETVKYFESTHDGIHQQMQNSYSQYGYPGYSQQFLGYPPYGYNGYMNMRMGMNWPTPGATMEQKPINEVDQQQMQMQYQNSLGASPTSSYASP